MTLRRPSRGSSSLGRVALSAMCMMGVPGGRPKSQDRKNINKNTNKKANKKDQTPPICYLANLSQLAQLAEAGRFDGRMVFHGGQAPFLVVR